MKSCLEKCHENKYKLKMLALWPRAATDHDALGEFTNPWQDRGYEEEILGHV